MPNEKNLTHRLTVDEQRAGGKASGEARRRKKLLADCLTTLLEREYTDPNGNMMDGADLISLRLFRQAMDGDTKAFTIIRDTIGQMPVQRIETTEIPQEVYDRVERALEGE